jgi:ATP-binding cassette subfamily B protein
VWELKHIIRNYYKNIADAQEMAEIFELPHEIVDVKGAKRLKVRAGEIVFDKVSFSYQKTRSIFKNMDLTIGAKQKVALVGHSGAGKSTLIKLLMRQHDVSGGKIFIDHQEVGKVTMSSLWKQVSFVAQDSILFHRTLMENIRYGRPGASDAEVIKAAKLARAHQFIKKLPEGYKTYVGERGVKLSGGERQRVAIARAILRNAITARIFFSLVRSMTSRSIPGANPQ